MNKIFRIALSQLAVLLMVAPCFAAASKNINVTAAVPSVSSALNVVVSKVRASDGVFEQSGANLPIDFGTLTLDPVNNIFVSSYYYAVDVGVTDNTGVNWILTHTRNSVQKDAANNLDDNINVAFVKQTSSSDGTQLQRLSYANSNNVSYDKTALSGAFLRIYYGIGTGAGTDATGVVPVGADKPAGVYNGSVLITLTP
ncbi:MAG: hypothetical protein PHS09_06830 [Candidatus Omnitrophica bacterium]|jgi:hypothetical protein|nr:hypothetical protein [Candidatus Omnitrophota bacterium]